MRVFFMCRKKVATFFLIVFVLTGVWALLQMYRLKPWLPALLVQQMFQKDPAEKVKAPVDLIFVFADHYEPHHVAAVERWEKMYPRIALRHRDADGRMPQHTFFWYWRDDAGKVTVPYLLRLAKLVYEGYGEVEFHLHHDDDTSQTVTEEIEKRSRLSQMSGAFITAEPSPRTAYAFIHGMWALDNSRRGDACGVSDELEILRKTGCFADFTHSSWGPMNPRISNTLYYAKDDPIRPKSYDRGRRVQVGGKPWGDLLIFEGPSVLSFEKGRVRYDHGDVTMEDLPTPERIDRWVRTAIHVKGRPEWIFVKVFTHGTVARDHEALLGRWAETMYRHLETRYNDGKRYRLHYATAREAYNILKAAEAGHSGNPNDFRDFVIPPYANRKILSSVPYQLITYRPERFELVSLSDGEGHILFQEGPVEEIRGVLRHVVVMVSPQGEPQMRLQGEGTARIKMRGRSSWTDVHFDQDMFKEVALK